MFKKISTLVLVLTLAPMVSAGVLQFTVDGQLAPDSPAYAAELLRSQTVEIGIDMVEGEFDGLDIGLQITGPGSIDISGIAYPATGWSLGPSVVADPTYDLRLTASVLTILGVPTVKAPGVLANNIIFHCDGEGDVTIDLIVAGATTDFIDDSQDPSVSVPYQLGTVLDSMTIHQVIPEPITVALLGMGGLFLRRKRA